MTNSIKILLFFIGFMIGCSKNEQISNIKDYEKFLTTKQTTMKTIAEKKFWETKYENAPNQSAYLRKLASAHITMFEKTGSIQNLHEAERNLTEANYRSNLGNASLLQSLAKLYITQHRFREAYQLLQRSDSIGEHKLTSKLMLFDVNMELGNYKESQDILDSLRDPSDFDYLIRLAKWQDHQGNLDAAIISLEKAMELAIRDRSESRILWSCSNLADFYGHAGRIQESYDHYIKALEINPEYYYAMKGIAWIIFSHERNPEGAKQIIRAIMKKHKVPDYHLLLAEIADYENDVNLYNKHVDAYFRMLDSLDYGDMYNAYSIEIQASDFRTVDQAIELAKREVNNRPTPASYDFLAWTLYNKGEKSKALEIVMSHVYGKTSEPRALYHTAEIFKVFEKDKKVAQIKRELTGAIYELGPSYESKIMAL